MAIPERAIANFIHQESWWRNRGLLVLNICLVLPLLSSTLNGLDSSILNGLQILPGWQEYFHDPQGKTLGLINSAQGIGALSGIPFSPYVSDLLGRRATMFIGAFIVLAGVFTQAFSTTVHVFVGARVLIGIGTAFSINAAPLLISELSYPTHRGKLTSLYNTMWYFGSINSAWICLAAYDRAGASAWSWRVPVLFQAAIPILQMVLIWFIPESPRFLAAKGLESKAARVLAHYHANGRNECDHLVAFEMAQIRHALNLEREIASSPSYLTCFTTPGNRRRMSIIIAIAIFSQWSGNGLVSSYINIVLDGVGINTTQTKAVINGVLQVFNLASALLGTMLVDKLGRRKLFLTSNIGMLIVFSMWTITTALFNETGSTAAAKATVPLIFMFYFFYDFAYTPMLVSYTLEILPYNIRAKGLAIMNFVAYLSNALNAFVNPWALDSMGWKYYLFYCGWLVLELIFVMVFIIETRGRTLEETAALFDGIKFSQNTTERRDSVTMARTSQYLRSPRLEKGVADNNYLELQERSRVLSYDLESPTRIDSQSEESAITFVK
ncbi:general substrate transporter [Suillus clintonianus]|uniref:general substrate transporter n=1 Tax=Suillus clintonianus TaxID=1904413 RepID=UPI001B88294C|nr:general substrate transporter [Suillus clintonianus]KAG2147560.1 general substrate transporter [Suillus clintonianus]